MYYNNETLQPIIANGKFFDFFPKSGHPMIISYNRINREILVKKDTNQIVFGDAISRKEIHSICKLRQIFTALICQEIELVNKHGTYNIGINLESRINGYIPFLIDIKHEDRELIIDQLIFDILAFKYCIDSPRKTLRQYSLDQSKYNLRNTSEANRVESIRKCISKALKKQTAIMNNQYLRQEIIEMGTNPDEYFNYYNQVSTPFTANKMPQKHERFKFEWDRIYYNADSKLITGKQYDRSFSKNGNYSHNDFVDLFNEGLPFTAILISDV